MTQATSRVEHSRFVRFALVGGATAALYFGLLAILLEYLRLDYRIAVSVAYLISVAFHFLSNRRFTFASHRLSPLPQLARYLVFVGASYVITMTIVSVSVELMHLSPFWGVVTAVIVTTGIGFLTSKHWIFKNEV